MIKQLFDTDWQYVDRVALYGDPSAVWTPVTLPHDISITKPRSKSATTGAGGGYAWSGVVTYRKKVHVPEDWQGKSVQLEFDGVYMNARVSVNRNLVTFHPYGYTSFLVDLSEYLEYGAENEISVVVNNSAQPNSRWYSGSGIYRHVWLRLGEPLHFLPWGLFVTTPQVDASSASVAVTMEMEGAGEGVSVRAVILDAGNKVVARAEAPAVGESAVLKLSVANPQLWSLETPTLYRLEADLLQDGEVVDIESTTFGIRTISVDPQSGFRLNGVPMKLKGGCVHHDNGLLGATSYDRAEERKIELMKASGYNAIRCAHNPPAPAMLDACDRLGMLVIDETFDCWRMGKTPNDYQLYFEDWWQRDTEAMILRDRNHPSIILWSIGNEVGERTGVSDGYAWCKIQADYVRSLDSTRWVTSALPFLFEEMMADPDFDPSKMFDSQSLIPKSPDKDRFGRLTAPFFASLDVGGYNYLNVRYQSDTQRFPGRIMCGTETWPHDAFETWRDTLALPNVIGDFVWTSLDYLGESGIGIVNVDVADELFFNREVYPYHIANCGDIDICGFKRAQSYFRDILWEHRAAPYIAVLPPELFGRKVTFNPWGWEPVVGSWTFPEQAGKTTRVDVYSADDEVELWINGVSQGRKPAGAAVKNKASFEVVYQPGEIRAQGYRGGQAAGSDSLKSAGQPVGLRLSADRSAIRAEYGDLSYVTVEVVDADGNWVTWGDPEVAFEVEGPAEIAALGAASPLTEELYVGVSQRKAFEGRMIAVIRSSGAAGEIRLKASAEGLAAAEIGIKAG